MTGVLISGSYGGSTFDAQLSDPAGVAGALGQPSGVRVWRSRRNLRGGYIGWVMAYNKSTLPQTGAFATVTTGNQGGGVWQSGRPPVVDGAGYVYVFVGNGYGSGGYDGVSDFSESALKLDPSHGLASWWTGSRPRLAPSRKQ